MNKVPGRLLLAPMQTITDSVFRTLITGLGAVDGCCSVYARVSHSAVGLNALVGVCPELRTDCRTPSNTPVTLQLLGGDPAHMALTAVIAVNAGAQRIDVNFGCPVPRVNRHDGGAALLQFPDRMTRILREIRDAVGTGVVLSCKLRIGWDSPLQVVGLARAVEQGGVDYMVLHGRTRLQGYGGSADWRAICAARVAVSIPVVANGDVCDERDLRECQAQTGCESFMIGRGVLRRPEVFRVLAGLDTDWWGSQKRLAILVHYGDMLEQASLLDRSIVGRVKCWWRYMAEVDPTIAERFEEVKRSSTWRQLRDQLCGFCNDAYATMPDISDTLIREKQ